MKYVLGALALTSTLIFSGAASASCSISDQVNSRVWETIATENCGWGKKGAYWVNGAGTCYEHKKKSTQVSFNDLQKIELEKKGYALVPSYLSQFSFSRDETFKGNKEVFKLWAKSVKKDIWLKKIRRGGIPKSVKRNSANAKLDRSIQELSAQRTRSNDPGEIVRISGEIDQLSRLIDTDLDETVPGKSTIDMAIEALPPCN